MWLRVSTASALAMLVAAVVQTSAQSADNRPIDIYADTGRPLARAIEEIENRLGLVVTYEDPPYRHFSDLRDATMEVRRDFDLSKKVFVPNGLPFRLRIDNPASNDAVLQELMKSYEQSGNATKFKLEKAGTTFHVVPLMVKNKDGHLESHRGVLDTRVSIQNADRSAYEMVQALVSALTSESGTKIALGTVPTNLLMQTRVRDGSSREQARTVLMRTLTATNATLSWQLFYGPGDNPLYVLNITAVQISRPDR